MNPTERSQIAAAEAAPFAVISHEFSQDSQGYGLNDWGYVATSHTTEAEALAEFDRRKASLPAMTSEMQGSRRVMTGETVTAYSRYGQDGEAQLNTASSV